MRLSDVLRRARRAGLGPLLDGAIDVTDAVCGRLGYFPLRATHDGITLHGKLRHHGFLSCVAHDAEAIGRTLEATLRPGWMFIDGGAHIGYHTVRAARLVGPHGRVLAFEPDPYNLAALTRNVRGLANVEVRSEALGAARGVATFRRSRGTISSSLLPRTGMGTTDEFDVAVVPIDDVVPDHAPVFVKLDLEGGELMAIDGLHRTAARVAELIVMAEVSQTALSFADKTPFDLIDALEGLGLDVREVRADNKVVPARETRLWKGNLLAQRG